MKEVSHCLYITVRLSSFVLFLTKEEMCLSALFDEILLANVNKVQERISVACAWFYARFLADDSEDEMLFRANRLLIPRKYPLPEPQGPHEAELLESRQHSRKKALLKAQFYDIVEEYGERFRMDGAQAPPTVVEGLNSCVDSFITNTVDQLSLKMQQGFLRGATVDQMISTLTLAFADKAQRFHSRVKDFYTQAAWYGVLQSYDTGQRFVFQVDKQDGTCERCSAQAGVIYTADEIVQNDLLPPLHPNCRCSILTLEQALQIGGGGDMKQDRIQLGMDAGERSQNSVLEPLMRIPSDAADMVHSFQLAQLARLQNGQYLDWITAGIVSGFWDGLETRAQTMLDNPTLYNIGNWLTLGLFDVIKGALFPEEPLSLQHWLDSAGLAATAYGGYKTYQQVKPLYSEKGKRGSAGGYEALDDVDDAAQTVDDTKVVKSGSVSPSQIAKSWQGKGNYPGIDEYQDIIVEKEVVLYRGEPNGSGYFTTKQAIDESGKNATKLFEGLQVEKHPIYGYRKNMQGYKAMIDIEAAYGIVKANPQFGNGGLPQIFIPNIHELIQKGYLKPVETITLY